MTYQINPDVVWVGDDDEIKLYDSASGDFKTLDNTAAEIWQLAAQGRDLRQMIEFLVAKYASDDEHEERIVTSDTERFVADLVARELLIEARDAGHEGPGYEGGPGYEDGHAGGR